MSEFDGDNDPSPGARPQRREHSGPAKFAPQRLAKILAAAGIDARRKCEEFVTTGRVTVDGKVITDVAFRADPYSQKIELDGEKLKVHRKVYFVLNKPRGVVCTNFDPAGKPLVVRQGGTIFFQGTFNPDTDSGAGTPGAEPPSEREESLTSTGLDGDASGRVRYRVDDRGRHDFNVEIEDVPVGNYTLRVAGAVRGTIRVLSTVNGVQGEIEFSTKIEPGHVLLTFDPRGQLIEVLSPAGIFFSHLFGSGSSSN